MHLLVAAVGFEVDTQCGVDGNSLAHHRYSAILPESPFNHMLKRGIAIEITI